MTVRSVVRYGDGGDEDYTQAPLMYIKKHDVYYCVACKHEFARDEEEYRLIEPKKPAPESASSPAPKQAAPAPSTPSAPSSKKREEMTTTVSSRYVFAASLLMYRLGKKMLQGWTMMEEACEICWTPLMKDPNDGKLYCVGCEKFVDDEVEEEELKATAPVSTSTVAPSLKKVIDDQIAVITMRLASSTTSKDTIEHTTALLNLMELRRMST